MLKPDTGGANGVVATTNYRVQLLMVFPRYTQAIIQAQILRIMYMVGCVMGWARSGSESRSVVDASGRLLSPPIISGYSSSANSFLHTGFRLLLQIEHGSWYS